MSERKKQETGQSIMSKEQQLFFAGINRIKQLSAPYEGQEIPPSVKEQIDSIKIKLYSSIYKYCYSIYHGLNIGDKANMRDVYQEMYIIFETALMDYDPTYTTPTTYFQRRFYEALSNEIKNSSGHTTQTQKNIRIVKRALNNLHAQGIDDPDIRMIANETTLLPDRKGNVGKMALSPKVVQETLQAINLVHTSNIDDITSTSSDVKTPEQAYIEAEMSEILLAALAKEDPEEVEILKAYYLGDTRSQKKKHVATSVVAKQFNKTESQVRAIVNRLAQKLRHDESLVDIGAQYYKTRNKVLGDAPMPLGTDSTSATVEEEFSDALQDAFEALEREVDELEEKVRRDQERVAAIKKQRAERNAAKKREEEN